MDKKEVANLHNRILQLVLRGVEQIEISEELTDKTAKMLELYDKVVRAAIIIKSGEVADTAETSMSNDELMGDFE
jgi:hypothetical protein